MAGCLRALIGTPGCISGLWPASSVQRRLISTKRTIAAIAVSSDGRWRIATAEDGNRSDQADGFIRIDEASSLNEQVALNASQKPNSTSSRSPRRADRLAVGGQYGAATPLEVPSLAVDLDSVTTMGAP